ncbi:MAG: FAD-dependent oxidoreductase [Leptolyngbya sp. DLM2.Bin27]|nr:MAG: FAD-dependent oxidoreductase [Leptolyngbya sp. DLM2.Bin27]
MKIAIIGGGASGMVTAYWLDQQGHRVTLYERQPVLGGHIRTLNKNIPGSPDCPELLEAGVLEFPVAFTHFLALMQELDVPLEPVEVGSGIFFEDGHHFLSAGMITHNFHGLEKWCEILHTDTLYARALGLWLKTHLARPDSLQGQPLAAYFTPETAQHIWMKLLTMYSYSMPYETIADFPAALAIPALRRYVFSHWVRIRGGVYSYLEKILARFSGEVVLNAEIAAVHRSNHAVQINGKIQGSQPFNQQFDRVVFATPPDQVLALLADPRPDEVRRFQAWQPNQATTILHCDRTLYQPYGIRQGSEFDFFQTAGGWGYNAYLNQLCGISSNQTYHLAFNLQDRIAPDKIIHVQQHHTPFYDVAAFQHRDDIIATNGEHNTYHVGAYLGDGLHEGAVTSAMDVAQAIGPADTEKTNLFNRLAVSEMT